MPKLKELELKELMPELKELELEELMPKLKELELEAPQFAQLQGTGPRVEYQQSTSPRSVPKEENERHEAWPATD